MCSSLHRLMRKGKRGVWRYIGQTGLAGSSISMEAGGLTCTNTLLTPNRYNQLQCEETNAVYVTAPSIPIRTENDAALLKPETLPRWGTTPLTDLESLTADDINIYNIPKLDFSLIAPTDNREPHCTTPPKQPQPCPSKPPQQSPASAASSSNLPIRYINSALFEHKS